MALTLFNLFKSLTKFQNSFHHGTRGRFMSNRVKFSANFLSGKLTACSDRGCIENIRFLDTKQSCFSVEEQWIVIILCESTTERLKEL